MRNNDSRQEYFAYFGYGSLVNHQTLRTDYVSRCRASVHGWRRHWQSRGDVAPQGDAIAMLNVHRHAESRLDGVIVLDRAENLAALDAREMRYAKVAIHTDLIAFDGDRPEDMPENRIPLCRSTAPRDQPVQAAAKLSRCGHAGAI